MKSTFKILCLATLLCFAGTQINAARPTNRIQTGQERQVRNFSGIAISGSVNAHVKLGTTENVRLEGDADAIAELITEVKEGVLIVRPKTKWMDWSKKFRNTRITVHITAKKLTSLTLSGSGSINVDGTLQGSELNTVISGSGSIKVATNVKSLNAVISGSGSIAANGKADETNITLGGSGVFKGKDLVSQNVAAQISGSGNVYITANSRLDAVVSGSGTLHYSGNATVEKSVSGSGGVRRI